MELDCVNKISVDTSICTKPCSGIVVTGFNKFQENEKSKNLFPIMGFYNKYKKVTLYPTGLIGKECKDFI